MFVTYRVANVSDAEELKRLNDEFNGEGCNTAECIREGLNREDAETVFVAELDHVLVGFCCGQLLKSICYSVFYAEITELYVNTSYQRQGVGRNLMSFAEEWYRDRGIHNFQLFTGKENINAQKFYEHIGYRRNEDIFYRKRDSWNSTGGHIMETIALVFPTKEFEEKVLDYKNEFEANGDSMDGTAGLKNASSFDEWVSALNDNSREETVRQGFVPSSTYLAIRMCDNRLVGMIDIRHRLNDYLFHFGGHIGYSVRKSERRKGYAKEMLRLALKICGDKNIDKVLITCDKDNIASAKTIISNGGVLENEVKEGIRITQRYWISVDNKI